MGKRWLFWWAGLLMGLGFAVHHLVVVPRAGLEELAGQRVELGFDRVEVGLGHPVLDAGIGDLFAGGAESEQRAFLAFDALTTEQLRMIVPGVIDPRDVAIGNLTDEALRQRNAHGFASRWQVDPEVTVQCQE